MMDIGRAREIIETLADGVNPLTGEILSDSDSCNQADVVRALHVAVAVLDKQIARETRSLPDNAGKPWLEEEDDKLKEEYDQGLTANEIAKLHKRSRGAITSRLVKLNIITTSDQER